MEFLERLNNVVWGIPTLVLILGVGLYLSLRTGFAQLRLLPSAIRAFINKFRKNDGNTSSFQALCTALAATVGTGNIAGVAGAIALGGPGSIFWMWVCAVLGMMIKCAEALLAVRYRITDASGSCSGGPMYMIELGLGRRWRPMAVCYCLFGVAAAFGVGNATQVNAVIGSINTAIEYLGTQPSVSVNLFVGVLLGVSAAAVFLGGFQRVGNVAELLVPVSSAGYMILCAGALLYKFEAIPQALQVIVTGALQPRAVTGGAVGSAFMVLRVGAARGIFTNEAGMGTAAIAHSSAKVKDPVEQGLMGIIEVFLDTLVICSMTALVILTSGVNIPYGTDEGAVLTSRAFAATYGPWVSIPISMFLAVFAFATILGWGYYGLQCANYLFGAKGTRLFILLQAGTAVVSTVIKTSTVWLFAELVNGLMAVPNLLALALLSTTVVSQTRAFIQEEHQRRASDKNPPEGNRWRHAHCREHESLESFHR